jgi:hypothetical protein
MQLTRKNMKQGLLGLLWILLVPVITYVASMDMKFGVAFSVLAIGGALSLVCIFNYKLGYYLYISITFILPMLERMAGQEISKGVAMDGLLLSTFLGCIFHRGDKTFKKINFTGDPILICMYLYLVVLVSQLFNPTSVSLLGWYTFLRVALRSYIFLYIGLNVFNSMKDVYNFFKFWLALGSAAALYCCLQQWFGLFWYEKAYMAAYPEKYKTTIIIFGIRLFSFMSDAAVLGIVLGCNITLMLILLTANLRTISLPKKIIMLISVVLHTLALGYSGTRTGYVMLPLGLMIFFIANMHKRNTILVAMGFAFFGLVILFGPIHGNATVNRVRTAFIGEQDESVNVRDRNRARIRPFMHTHPMGGGVNTTGGNGETYHPGHVLAGFQTDNGYLRAVLETGWISMLLVAGVFYLLVHTAVINFFRATTELDKLLMIGLAAASFAAAISEYAQDTFTLVETSIMLFAFIAIAIKVKYLNV